MEGKNRLGGAMGIGYKKAVQEWWFNIEIFTYDKLVPVQDVYVPFNEFTYKEEVKYTDVNVILLFHKEITKPKRDIQGRVLFWELGGGINSLQRDQADAKTALALQAGLGMDFNKKIRVRLTPFVKMASETVTGVQISAFILIGLDRPIETQVEK